MSSNSNHSQASQNIQVAVRCRPLNDRERKQNSSCVIECNEKKREVTAFDRSALVPNNKTFTFDRVFGMNSKQVDVYNQVVRPVVREVIEGYNCTIFAYGQTGTGKTFTMEGERSASSGSDDSCAWEDDPMVGLIPRAVAQLFSTLKAMSNCEYSVKVSFIELYNEELSDLLGDVNVEKSLRIYEDPNRKGSVTIPGLEEVLVKSKSEVYAVLQRGADRRKKAETLMNANSSRSHSIFTVTVCIKEKSLDETNKKLIMKPLKHKKADSLKGGEETLKIGKLNLVDLAGSENIERSGATGKRATEAGKINKSLTTLGRVITSLVEHRDHIPYRESNLTRLLQDSLGGRTKTTIIATISPAQCNLEETLSTLDYAHKAKSIRNKPEINQKIQKALIKEYTEENDRLKRELWAMREKNGVHLPFDMYQEMQQSAERQKEEIRELTIKVQAMTDESLKTNEILENTKQQLEEKIETLHQTERVLGEVRGRLVQTEVERDETKYLLDEHVGTEKKLYEQATSVIQAYESAQLDNLALYNKLNDVRCTMNTNHDLVRTYASDTVDGIEHMDHDEREYRAGSELMVERLKESLYQGKDIVAELVDSKLRPQLHQFEQKQAQWMITLANVITKEIKTKMYECTKELTEKLESTMRKRERNYEIVDKALCDRREHQGWLSESMHTRMRNEHKLANEFQTKFDHMRSECTSQTITSMSNLAQAAKSCLETHSIESASIRDNIDTFAQMEKDQEARVSQTYAKIEALLEQSKICLAQSTELLRESKANEEAANAEKNAIVAEIKSRTSLMTEKASVEADWMIKKNAEFVDEIRKSQDELVGEPVKQFLESHHKYLEEALSIVQKLNENYESTDAFVLEKNMDSIKFEEEKSAEFNSLLTNQQQHVENICDKLEIGIDANKKEIIDTLADLADETVVREKMAFEQQVANSLQISSQLKFSIDQHSQECIEFLSNGMQSIEDLENKYLKETETGRTPTKRKSTEAVELTKTKPHHELLDLYRRRNQVEINVEFKTPIPPQASPGSSGSGSSLNAPSSKRAAYGSTNDLENMVIDVVVDEKPVMQNEKLAPPSQPLAVMSKNPSLSKNLSSRALFNNMTKKASSSSVLRDRNN